MFKISLFVLLMMTAITAHAQYCNPAAVSYLVRDENGSLVQGSELNGIIEKLPKTIDESAVASDRVSFSDEQHFYRQESADWDKGRKVEAIGIANASKCTLKLNELTLTYHGKRMHLVFNIDIARGENDRRLVIDSLPFDEGTYKLDLSAFTHERDQLIPALSWKKVAKKVNEDESGYFQNRER